MDNLYTDEVKDIFRSQNWPAGSPIRMIEYPGYLVLSVKRSDFETLDHRTRLTISDKINTFMWTLRGKGVPIYLEAT